MPVVGIAEVLVQPVFTGLQRSISRQIGSSASQAGRTAGASMGSGMATGFASSAGKLVTGLSAITPAAGAAGAAVLAASGNALTLATSLSSLAGVAALVPAGLMSIGAGAGVLVTAFSGVGEALKTAVDAAGAVASTNPRLAAMAVEDAMQAITVAEENAAEAQESAARRVADAKRDLLDVTLAVAEAHEAAVKSVEMAERDEARAARDVIEAQKDLAKAREDAAKKADTVGRQLEAANRKAVDVAEAYRLAVAHYERAAADPSASQAQLERLENNVATALAANEAAQRSVSDLQGEHTKAQEEAAASNEKVLDAEQRLSDARQAQADAIQARKDAQADVLKQEQEGAQRIADAQQAVADATKQAERSQVDAARSVEQAHRNLERVQMQQADQAAQAGAKSADAMSKLTPSAQEAVRALLLVKEQLGGIRRIAQENFFKGFAAPLLSLAGSVMPQLAAGVGAIASEMGAGTQIFMRALESSLGGGVLESLLMGVAKSTAILNQGITPVVEAFTTLGVVGMDYMPQLAQLVSDIATRFNDFIQAAAADGRLKGWIDGGIQSLKDLWSIADSVGGIFSAMNRAAEAGGAVSTLGGMAATLRTVETIMQGEVFQTAMATIFSGAEKGAQGLLAALGPIGDAFVRGAPAMAEFLRLGGEIAGTFLGGVFTALSNPAFGAGLTTFMEALQRGVEAIAPLLPGVTTAFGSLLTAIAPIVEQIGPTLVEVFTGLASGLASLISFLAPVLTAIAGSPVALSLLIGAVIAAKLALAGMSAAVGFMQTAMAIWAARSQIAAAAQWLLNGALRAFPIVALITAIAAVVAGLIWFFTQTELGKQIVQNVWAAIQTAVSAVVDWFQNTAMPIIQTVFAVIGAVFSWLYENIVRPVFDGIATVANAAWLVLRGIFQVITSVIQNVLGPAISWLYENVFKPVFGFIGALIGTWWNLTVKPIFDTVVWLLNNVLGPAFKWLYENAIKPAFDGIGKAIEWVWLNVVKPVFDTLSDFITKTIPKAFEDGVGFIRTAWEKLQEIAKAPVKFVVDTVINDGLIGAFNTVAGILPGVDKLPRVALPPGFSEGGYTGPGGKYQPAGIVHAGEIVWSQDDIARWGGVGVVEAMRKAVGYARGGLVHPLRASSVSQPFHGGHNGIDFAAPTGTPIVAAGPGRVSSAGWSSYGGGNEIHIDHPNGLQTWYAHLSSFAVKLGQMVSSGTKIGEVGSTGNSSGPHLHYMVFNGGWPNYVNPSPYLDGGGEAGKAGWNPIAGIIDGLVTKFKEAFPAAGMVADIAIGIGKKLLTSASDFITGGGGKDDGIGSTGLPYLHDQGGVLYPGLSLIMNATRKPEAILNQQQWSDIHELAMARGGAGTGMTYAPTYQWAGDDPHAVMAKDKARMRDTLNAYS